MKAMLAFSQLALLVVVSAVITLYLYQNRLIFFPSKLPADYRYPFAGDIAEASVKLASGEEINYLTFNGQENTGHILYFHGNAGSLADWGFAAEEIRNRTGWTVWIMDYPGYGKSTGAIPSSEAVLHKLGHEFFNLVRSKFPDQPIVAYGRSVGSGIATEIAASDKISGLVWETPYLSLAELAKDIYPFVPSFLLRVKLSNLGISESSQTIRPIIFHGDRDEVISYRHGQELHALNKGSTLVTIAGGNHNNLSEFPEYWEGLSKYLTLLLSAETN